MDQDLPYKQLRKLHGWLKENRDEFDVGPRLAGLCGISAYLCFLMLRKMNLPVVFRENDSHAFVSVDDFIIDLTAKQFNKNYPNVMVFNFKNGRKLQYYHETHRVGTSASRIRQLFRIWPSDQIPFNVIPELPEEKRKELESIIGTKFRMKPLTDLK